MSRLPPPPRIIVLTGPGLSREAGFAPFDPERLPSGLSLRDVLTPEAFARDHGRVHDFYNRRRRELLESRPSPAYDALAVLEATRPGSVLIVTRNIDDLHERAGSRGVIHTHGELLKARCLICTQVSECLDDIRPDTACPICGNAGHLRPHVVWVGEPPLRMELAYQAAAECAVFAVIGTSAANEPVAGLLADAKRRGAHTIEFSPERSPASDGFDECRIGRLADTVPAWVKELIAST